MTKVTETDLAELKDLILNSVRSSEQSFQALGQKIETLQKDVTKLEGKVDAVQKDVTDLKLGQVRTETEIKSVKEEVKELKTTQKAQIWALITLAFTAVITLSAAISKLIFFPENP